jgi:hypothetical protein
MVVSAKVASFISAFMIVVGLWVFFKYIWGQDYEELE